jgi:TonB family protein
MRDITLVLIFFNFVHIARAQQQPNVTYFDHDWKKVNAPMIPAYYRETVERNDTFRVHDFFISGALQMTGAFLDPACVIREGCFTYYTQQGVKKAEEQYKNGLREGVCRYWTETGELSKTANYIHDTLNGAEIAYYPNGKERFLIIYDMGVARSSKAWNQMGELVESKDSIIIKEYAESMPTFPGGNEAMIEFLQQEMVYPKAARKKGIEGRVVLQFVINIDGWITNIEVVRSVEKSLDDEARRVISLMPQWTPGTQNGKPVYVKFTLPIVFKL